MKSTKLWALILDEKHKAMEKKSQPLVFVGYYKDIYAYKVCDPISKDFLFRRDAHFDEHFDLIISPNPPIDCIIDNSEDHTNNFIFIEKEDDENFIVASHTIGDVNQQIGNLAKVSN